MARDSRVLLCAVCLCVSVITLAVIDSNRGTWNTTSDVRNPLLNYLLPEFRQTPPSDKCNTTIISAYYKIKSKHSYEEYLSWMINFLSMRDCMVIFVQPDLERVIHTLRPPAYPTFIIPRPFESFLVSTLLSSEEWEEQERLDPQQYPGHNWKLFTVWNEKTNMMKIVSDINPFSSSYFVWLDIGAVRHGKYNYQQMVRNIPQEKGVLLLNVDKFTEQEQKLEEGRSLADFSLVDRIGGTTIGCDQDTLFGWHTAFYRTMRTYLEKGRFIGKDQNMMATTCLETDLCLLVQGDLKHWFRLQEWLRGEIEGNLNKLDLIKH
eukprot:GFUD01005341.1.p1 GENE.GFUD01005341.1~~GFUD01005341.1.p1  ORF type:complete len:320 (-),score=104.59 GFUD01005341.1:96-1055(-)